MTATTIRVQMAQRKDTAANWTAANPILLSGEIGYETDTKKFKIGDGTTNWNSLAYLPIPDGSGNLTITGNLEIGTTGSLTFEGSTANGFETTLAVSDPTADRTITLPNVSGTVVTTGDTGSVTSTMIADGTIVNADISGSAEIAVSKLANGTANQVIVTDGTNVSWSDNLTLAGDLTVNGTTTTINTENLLVEDKNIIIGNVASPTDVTADGGGITLKGATDKTINWVDSTDAWTSSERFSYPLGSAAAPSLTFTGDPNTGIYSPGADQVALATGGTGRLFVDASGNVGIGASATARLESNQNIGFGSNGTFGAGQLYSDVNWGVILRAKQASPGAAEFAFQNAGGTERFRATGTGSFNIKGAGDGATTQAVSFNGSAPVNSLVVDSSGRLLVGTSSARSNFYGGASALLNVEGVSNAPGRLVSQTFGNSNAEGPISILAKHRSTSIGGITTVQSGDQLGVISFQGSDGTNFVESAAIQAQVDGTPGTNDMPGRLVFSTTADGAFSPTERMRITNEGVVGCFSGSDSLLLSTSLAAGTSKALIYGRYGSTNYNNGTNSFTVWTNGDVVNTNNSYGAISDAKLKENIVDANSQWDDLKALKVRNYNFKEGQTHTQIGLVAQEAELVSPGIVSESPDCDAEGNDLGTVTKSVNYSVLYMKAVKALQEAIERIETLEAKVAALEAA